MSHSTTSDSTRRRWLRLLLPLLVLFAGVGIAMALMQTAPKAQRQPPVKQARLVEVVKVMPGAAHVEIEAMGTVIPARRVVLAPQVSGEVLRIADDFVPGGRFRKGEELLRIDPADYELAVRQKESELAQARSNVRLEEGQQVIARREFELLGETAEGEDSALMLRAPQLAAVRASEAMAEAALARAKLDLDRTRITAPFNALVQSREVNAGTRVTTATALATLVGTDEYWLELSVPVDQLKWLAIPGIDAGPGSPVRIYDSAAWGEGVFREGRVIRLAGDLEQEGRMARVLVSVADPLAQREEHTGKQVLLLNSYVRTVIEGRQLENVVELQRSLLRDRDQVWVMDDAGQLRIRSVDTAFRGADTVFIEQGLAEGDRVVVTDLSAPVEGMPLRTGDDAPAVEPAP